jgi:hypothetical protein
VASVAQLSPDSTCTVLHSARGRRSLDLAKTVEFELELELVVLWADPRSGVVKVAEPGKL